MARWLFDEGVEAMGGNDCSSDEDRRDHHQRNERPWDAESVETLRPEPVLESNAETQPQAGAEHGTEDRGRYGLDGDHAAQLSTA